MKFIWSLFISILLSGPSGQAAGDLFAFQRDVETDVKECSKTWSIKYDLFAECKVTLWPVDHEEISFQPVALIGVWNYRDNDFKGTVTFNRDPEGYTISLTTNDAKFKDRLSFKVAEKYVVSAIKEKKYETFQSLIARTNQKVKTGKSFKETYRGPLQVFLRQLDFSRNGALYKNCAQAWDGFKCTFSFLRVNRGETLLDDLKQVKAKSGHLTFEIKSYQAWRDGTAFSTFNFQLRSDRYQKNLNAYASDYDVLAQKTPRIQYRATQIAGENEAGALYTQTLAGPLRAVAATVPLDAAKCRSTYKYDKSLFRGRCEVQYQWPGVMGQPSQIFMEFIDKKGLGSFVTLGVTPTGWRMDFSGVEKSVGKFASVESHFNAAAQITSQRPPRVFLAH